jgi:L-lactate utilization protein LutB
MDEFKHLSFASSLCGNCTEVCAVKINLHELLLENRHESVEEPPIGGPAAKTACARALAIRVGAAFVLRRLTGERAE